MRVIWLILVWLISSAMPALAQPVAVRSGGHDGFTRLVFYLPEGTEWSIEEAPRAAILATTPPASFDLSAVYDRIARDRLKDVRVGAMPGKLALDFGCDCTIRTQTLLGNALVLDLVDSSARDSSPEPEAPKPPDRLAEAEQPVVAAPSTIEAARKLTSDLTLPLLTKDSTAAVERVDRLAQVESNILEEVARASTQGLLTLAAPLPPGPEPEPPAEEVSTPAPLPDAEAPPSVLAHTSMTGADQLKPLLTGDGATCLPDKDFDLAAWAGEDGFTLGLGQHRSRLTGEFDRIQRSDIRDMAKFYIAFGFGAEALAVMDLASDGVNGFPHLASMARILERGHDPLASPFAGQADCDTAAAMWSLLASQAPKSVEANTAAILRALNALPLHVRGYLGVALAERFLAAEQPDMSRAILRVIDRSGPDEAERQPLVEGQIELDHGDEDAGRDVLSEAAEQDGETSPEALIKLVNHDLDAGHTIPSETAELIGAYVFQYRSSPIAEPLRALEVLARASAGQLDIAYELLAEREADESLGTSGENLRDRVTNFLLDADDTRFLNYGLKQISNHAAVLKAETKAKIAQRFQTLGFPDLAQTALATIPRERWADAHHLLDAEAALAQTRPRAALEAVDQLTSPEAEALRARARAMIGDHGTASQAFASLDMKQEADRQAWLAGEWSALGTSEDELKAAVATLMTGDPGADDGLGPLARNRRLLQDSVASRSTLEGLLSRYAVPTAPAN